jgi:hypothetical protein
MCIVDHGHVTPWVRGRVDSIARSELEIVRRGANCSYFTHVFINERVGGNIAQCKDATTGIWYTAGFDFQGKLAIVKILWTFGTLTRNLRNKVTLAL